MNSKHSSELEHFPDFLYKYRTLSDRTTNLIASRSIWLSRPSKLNDPLECRTGHVDPAEIKAIVKKLETAAALGLVDRVVNTQQVYSLTEEDATRWIQSIYRKSHKRRYEAVREMSERHGVRLSEPQRVVKAFQRDVSKVGILSLSADPANELMWAHYADEHRGLVLGFSCAEGTQLRGDKTVPVVYKDGPRASVVGGFNQRTEFRLTEGGKQVWNAAIPFDSDLFRAVISTKPTSWSYEKEWRYVEPNEGLYAWPAPLTSATFGLRMSRALRDEYRSLLKRSVGDSVEFYAMRISRENTLERYRLD